MKAVILAGGEGTRLRPLTLQTPKPIVPLFDRPFLSYQLDLLASVGIDEVVFSVAFEPERVRAVYGNGASVGFRIHYAVEASPLGTGGAVRNALAHLDETTVVFNGDVLTDVDLPAVVARHRDSGARATIVLTPVANPSAYGLVETDADGRVQRFVEKPKPEQITTDTINAGIYVLDTAALDLIPPGIPHSIERGFFPELLSRGDRVQAVVHRGYWIDIGTPEKYLQVHRDVLAGRFPVAAAPHGFDRVHPDARVHADAHVERPCYVGPGCQIPATARVGPGAVLVRDVTLAPGAEVRDSVIWSGGAIGAATLVEGCLLAADVTLGQHVALGRGSVLGAGTRLPDYSRLG